MGSDINCLPLVHQSGSLSKIFASLMWTSCTGLFLLMCRDTSKEVELSLSLLCSIAICVVKFNRDCKFHSINLSKQVPCSTVYACPNSDE